MKLPPILAFVVDSQLELLVVGFTFLALGSTLGFRPAAQSGWSILMLLLVAALLPRASTGHPPD